MLQTQNNSKVKLFSYNAPADKEEDNADADVGKDDAHPDLHRQRVHECENTRADLWSLLLL